MDVQGLIALFLCFPVGLALIMLAGLADLPLEDECPKVCPAPQQRPLDGARVEREMVLGLGPANFEHR